MEGGRLRGGRERERWRTVREKNSGRKKTEREDSVGQE